MFFVASRLAPHRAGDSGPSRKNRAVPNPEGPRPHPRPNAGTNRSRRGSTRRTRRARTSPPDATRALPPRDGARAAAPTKRARRRRPQALRAGRQPDERRLGRLRLERAVPVGLHRTDREGVHRRRRARATGHVVLHRRRVEGHLRRAGVAPHVRRRRAGQGRDIERVGGRISQRARHRQDQRGRLDLLLRRRPVREQRRRADRFLVLPLVGRDALGRNVRRIASRRRHPRAERLHARREDLHGARVQVGRQRRLRRRVALARERRRLPRRAGRRRDVRGGEQRVDEGRVGVYAEERHGGNVSSRLVLRRRHQRHAPVAGRPLLRRVRRGDAIVAIGERGAERPRARPVQHVPARTTRGCSCRTGWLVEQHLARRATPAGDRTVDDSRPCAERNGVPGGGRRAAQGRIAVTPPQAYAGRRSAQAREHIVLG